MRPFSAQVTRRLRAAVLGTFVALALTAPTPALAAEPDVVVPATIDGPQVTAARVADGQRAVIPFATGQPDRVLSVHVTVGGTALTYLHLRHPDGQVFDLRSCGQPCDLNGIGLPTVGDYELVLDNAQQEPFVVGLVDMSPVTGTLTVDGTPFPVDLDKPSKGARLTVPGVAGHLLGLRLENGTFGTQQMGLTVQAPDGSFAYSTVNAPNNAVVEPFLLPVTGDYTLWYHRVFSGGANGSITMTAYDVTHTATGAAVGGAPVRITTTTPGQNTTVTFAGVAGQKVSVWLSGGTLASGAATVRRPDGVAVAKANQQCGQTCFYDTLTLPVTGDYTLFYDPLGWSTGSIDLALVDAAPLLVPTAPGGPAVVAALPQPGRNAKITFTGTAGDRVSAALTGGTFGVAKNAKVSVLAPDGAVLVTAMNCGVSCFVEPVVLTASGEHTLLLDPQTTGTGQITAQVYAVPADVAVPATAGGPGVVVTLTGPGQNGVVSFVGTAGQQITVAVTGAAFGVSTSYILRAPDGTVLTTKSSAGATVTLTRVTLGVTGTYTVLVDPGTTGVGSATVRV
ncbi:hypothetical protein AB0M43_01960 [Longispora sp. NPDC051575]|uniref:hypothetical protein n=1 Tax=Longispora sp. NPDC051575 TaxID=3154943 RepID=UPI00342401E3